MTGFLYARGLYSTQCNLYSQHIVGKLDNGMTAGIREFQHFVYQASDTVGILQYLLIGLAARSFVKLHIPGSYHLRKARKDVKRCTELMRYLLDKTSLHARRLFGTLIGNG